MTFQCWLHSCRITHPYMLVWYIDLFKVFHQVKKIISVACFRSSSGCEPVARGVNLCCWQHAIKKPGINHRSRVYPTFHIIFYLLFTRTIGISTARWSTTLRTSVFRKINHFDGRGCKELWNKLSLSTRLHDATCQLVWSYQIIIGSKTKFCLSYDMLHENMKTLQPTSFQFINRKTERTIMNKYFNYKNILFF